MKRQYISVLLACIIMLTGCASDGSDGESLSEPLLAPTGYPTGTIQWEYVMINGYMYENIAKFADELPDGFDNYVETTEKLTEEMPHDNLQATWLEAGTGFYYSEEDNSVVYCVQSNNYRVYSRYDYEE